MAGQAPIVMTGQNFLESYGVVSNVATNVAAREQMEESFSLDGREVSPYSVSTHYVETAKLRVVEALVGKADVPKTHITNASTSHAITDFDTANSAANALGTKINAILTALEEVYIVYSS